MPLAPEIAKLLPAINAQPQMHELPLALLRLPRERIGATDFQPVDAVEKSPPNTTRCATAANGMHSGCAKKGWPSCCRATPG